MVYLLASYFDNRTVKIERNESFNTFEEADVRLEELRTQYLLTPPTSPRYLSIKRYHDDVTLKDVKIA